MIRASFTREAVRSLTKHANQQLRTLGGADSPEMKAAAGALKKSFRRILGQRGGGKPSAPGEPPRKQSGKLAKSIRDGVVGAARRVAVTWYTAPLLEGGVDTALPTRPNRRGKSRSRQGRLKGGKQHLRIAARPFRQRAIDAAAKEMAVILKSEAGDRLGQMFGKE